MPSRLVGETESGVGRLLRGRVAVTVFVVATAVAATAAPVGAVAGFGDVAEDRFFAEPVAWMVETGLTTGTEIGCFSPDDGTTRAQASTFIHRLAGTPPSSRAIESRGVV